MFLGFPLFELRQNMLLGPSILSIGLMGLVVQWTHSGLFISLRDSQDIEPCLLCVFILILYIISLSRLASIPYFRV